MMKFTIASQFSRAVTMRHSLNTLRKNNGARAFSRWARALKETSLNN